MVPISARLCCVAGCPLCCSRFCFRLVPVVPLALPVCGLVCPLLLLLLFCSPSSPPSSSSADSFGVGLSCGCWGAVGCGPPSSPSPPHLFGCPGCFSSIVSLFPLLMLSAFSVSSRRWHVSRARLLCFCSYVKVDFTLFCRSVRRYARYGRYPSTTDGDRRSRDGGSDQGRPV